MTSVELSSLLVHTGTHPPSADIDPQRNVVKIREEQSTREQICWLDWHFNLYLLLALEQASFYYIFKSGNKLSIFQYQVLEEHPIL